MYVYTQGLGYPETSPAFFLRFQLSRPISSGLSALLFCRSVIRRHSYGSSLSSPLSEAMNLACLACHSVDSSSESFRRYPTSDSDGEGRCGARMNCWSRKTPVAPPPEITNSIVSSRVAPQPAITSQGCPGSPRLMRCHAVRRDIFRDWHFDETSEEVQLWQ